MEQVDAHGAGADVGESSLFCPHDGQEGECQAESDAVADQAADHSLCNGLSQIVIVISAIKDLYRKHFMKRIKDQEGGKKQDPAGGQNLDGPVSETGDHFLLKMDTGQEEGIIDQNPGDTQEIVLHSGTADQKACENGQDHVMGDLLYIRGDRPPYKQSENVPQRELGAQKVQSGGFMKEHRVKKIVDHFIYQVGDSQLTDQILKGQLPFGEIAGDKDKSRHVERKDKPFQCIEKVIIHICGLDKMPDHHKEDQERFVVVV